MAWITYERHHWSGDSMLRVTKLDSEPAPKYFGKGRAATEEEVAIEVERRLMAKQQREVAEQFVARQDYQAAKAIRDILETMTPERHPLDVLTVSEWIELRKKLEG